MPGVRQILSKIGRLLPLNLNNMAAWTWHTWTNHQMTGEHGLKAFHRVTFLDEHLLLKAAKRWKIPPLQGLAYFKLLNPKWSALNICKYQLKQSTDLLSSVCLLLRNNICFKILLWNTVMNLSVNRRFKQVIRMTEILYVCKYMHVYIQL